MPFWSVSLRFKPVQCLYVCHLRQWHACAHASGLPHVGTHDFRSAIQLNCHYTISFISVLLRLEPFLKSWSCGRRRGTSIHPSPKTASSFARLIFQSWLTAPWFLTPAAIVVSICCSNSTKCSSCQSAERRMSTSQHPSSVKMRKEWGMHYWTAEMYIHIHTYTCTCISLCKRQQQNGWL